MKSNEENNLFNNDLAEKDWIGVVIDNNDPLHQFRCKINVFSLFDKLNAEEIPWAFPATNLSFAGGEGGCGSISVPRIGTIVKVKFDNGNLYAPEYWATQNVNSELVDEIKNDYTNAQVLCYDVDEKLKIYYTKGKGLYISLKETIIQIDNKNAIYITNPNGDSVKLNNDGTLDIKTSSNITVNCNGKMTANVKGTAEIEAPKIKLGKTAAEAVVKGTTFKQIFDNHFHLGNLGAPTTTAISQGFECPISKKSFTD